MSDDPAPAITQPPAYCTTTPRAGDRIAAPCPDCGHATVLHIGVDHCPVCELVELNRRARDGGRVEIRVEGAAVTEKKLIEAIEAAQRRRPPGSGGLRA
jgi:uncharacterized Zn finger protein (UPF0148 family)